MARDSLEVLGSAYRVRIRSAREGAALAATLRASGRVHDAWHSETMLAFTPLMADEGEARALLALPPSDATQPASEHLLETALDGPDRDEVARAAHLTRRELERLIYDASLEVSFVGFAPGFAYLRGLDPRLHLPRREAPRPRIPKGSLAIAGGFAGIYPSATAGGWNLIGSVHEPLLDALGPRLSAGDRVRFSPPSLDRTLRDPVVREARGEPWSIVLDDVRGLAFIEDGGRRGRLHQGVPISGALLPSALARANLAVGNEPGAAAIERYGALRVTARIDTLVASEDGRAHRLRPGESLDVDWHGEARAGYVAFAGGIQVPEVLGARGTHVRAGLGGLGGRALRRGDVLTVASPREPGLRDGLHRDGLHRHDVPRDGDRPAPRTPIAVHPGPDLAHFSEGSLARLTSTAWRISHQSDRMGTRLEGGRLELRKTAREAESVPLVIGAIEVPPSGEPIVLGPEHPTTGGYPVIGVLRASDLEAFSSLPLGSTVRFALEPH